MRTKLMYPCTAGGVGYNYYENNYKLSKGDSYSRCTLFSIFRYLLSQTKQLKAPSSSFTNNERLLRLFKQKIMGQFVAVDVDTF